MIVSVMPGDRSEPAQIIVSVMSSDPSEPASCQMIGPGKQPNNESRSKTAEMTVMDRNSSLCADVCICTLVNYGMKDGAANIRM